MFTRNTALPKLFKGMDIHKRTWKIHCNTGLFAGNLLLMPPDPEKVWAYFPNHVADHQVSNVYEASVVAIQLITALKFLAGNVFYPFFTN